MPWKETNVNEERMKFVVAWKQGGWTMSDLCREFDISRVTGYKYLRQYEEQGIDGLKNKSRAPKNQPNAVADNLIEIILKAREKHRRWGARKLLAWLEGKHPKKTFPCASTIGRILRRNGLTNKSKRRRRTVPVFPLSHVIEPNDVWCADFKGHFTVGDGQRCNPLTISDAYSRFLIGCQIVPKQDNHNAFGVFEGAFREYGMPQAIRTDNGVPFASRGLAGLSQLSVWWLKLGIMLERIEPGKPQQNGRHERMHRTLKQATALPPRSSLAAQQKAFDEFREEYNLERPHEAIKNKPPSKLYRRSSKPFPEKIPEVGYPTNMDVVKVNDLGNTIICGHRVFVSGALSEELIGLEEISERHIRMHFCSVALAVVDTYTGKVLQYKNPMPIEVEE